MSASYGAIHKWLVRHGSKSGVCEECGIPGRTEWALRHGCEHAKDHAQYRELCHRCHRRYDKLGVPHSPEHIANLRAALQGTGLGNRNASGSRSEEARANMRRGWEKRRVA